jgi:hypothetical protein
MRSEASNRALVKSGEARVRAPRANEMATADATIRSWIITAVLVLFGPTPPKLR